MMQRREQLESSEISLYDIGQWFDNCSIGFQQFGKFCKTLENQAKRFCLADVI